MIKAKKIYDDWTYDASSNKTSNHLIAETPNKNINVNSIELNKLIKLGILNSDDEVSDFFLHPDYTKEVVQNILPFDDNDEVINTIDDIIDNDKGLNDVHHPSLDQETFELMGTALEHGGDQHMADDHDKYVTKDALDSLKTNLEQKIDSNQQIITIKIESNQKMTGQRIDSLDKDLDRRFASNQQITGQRFNSLDKDLGRRFDAINDKIESSKRDTIHEIKELITTQSNEQSKAKTQTIRWTVGTGIAVVGLIFTIVKFFM